MCEVHVYNSIDTLIFFFSFFLCGYLFWRKLCIKCQQFLNDWSLQLPCFGDQMVCLQLLKDGILRFIFSSQKKGKMQAYKKDGLMEGIAKTSFSTVISKLDQIGYIRGNMRNFWVGAEEGGRIFLKTGRWINSISSQCEQSALLLGLCLGWT